LKAEGLLQQLRLVGRARDREQGCELVETQPALGEGVGQQGQVLDCRGGLHPAAGGNEADAGACTATQPGSSFPVALADALSPVGRDHTKKLPQRGVVATVQLIHGGAELVCAEAVVTRLFHGHHATGDL
jgi:hypothetical protein